MAAVNITISGVLCDKYGRTIRPVTLVGEASITGLGVGGGPVVPPGGDGDHIWGGPIDPYPDHGLPGPQPPAGAHPEHPIVLPEPPVEVPPGPADDQGFLKPPPDGGWGYHNVYGWLYNPAEGVATPKA